MPKMGTSVKDWTVEMFDGECKKILSGVPELKTRKLQKLVSVRQVYGEDGKKKSVWGCGVNDYQFLAKIPPILEQNKQMSQQQKLVADYASKLAMASMALALKMNSSGIKPGPSISINTDTSTSTSSAPVPAPTAALGGAELQLLPASVKHAMLEHRDLKINTELMTAQITKRIGQKFWDGLLDFQKEGVIYCISREGRVLIADDMGLGKTRQSLAAATYYRPSWPLLVICLASCVSNWLGEVLANLDVDPDDIEVIRSGKNLTDAHKPDKVKSKPKAKAKAKAKTKTKAKSKRKFDDEEDNADDNDNDGDNDGDDDSDDDDSESESRKQQIAAILSLPPIYLPQPSSSSSSLSSSTSTSSSVPVSKFALPTSIDYFKSLPTGVPEFKFVLPKTAEEKAKENSCPWRGWEGGKLKKPQVTIISYDLAKRHCPLLLARGYKIMIVDESQTIKNKDSQVAQAVTQLAHATRQCFYLSGTPLSRSREIFTTMNSLYPEIFPDYITFVERYADPQNKEFFKGGSKCTRRVYDGRSYSNELHILLRTLMMIRREKSEVNLPLPPKSRVQFILNPEKKYAKLVAKQMERIESLAGRAGLADDDDEGSDVGLNLGLPSEQDLEGKKFGKDNPFMQAVRKIAKYKLPQVQEYVRQLIRNTPKVDANGQVQKWLFFGHHKSLIAGVREVLIEENVGHVKIDGGTDKKLVGDILHTFHNNPDCRVALLSVTSAGIGLNMTAATKVVFLEMHLSAVMLLQAECRAHRIGQKFPVECTYLIFPGSIEELIWQMINAKHKTMTTIVDGRSKHFSSDKVQDL